MIAREQQKAILEAMLFVSPRPVTLAQMMRRIRTIIRQQTPLGQELPTADGLQSGADSVVSNQVEVDLVAAGSEMSVASDVEFQGDADADAEGVSEGADVLAQLLGKKRELDDDVNREEIKALLLEIQAGYNQEDRGIELVQVAKGWQFRTKYEISQLIRDEIEAGPIRLSPSSLEVLSIVAYQQPVTRQKIDEVRGVDSGGVLKTLLEKGFLKLVGRSEEPGKPLIYGTSPQFLEVFGLQSLKELPSLADLESLQMASSDGTAQDAVAAGPDALFSFDETQESAVNHEVYENTQDQEATLDQADMEILTELDDSLKTLRTLEKDIFTESAATGNEGAGSAPAGTDAARLVE